MAKESTIADTGIADKVISEIQNLAEKYGVREVILFGSRARGAYGRASDIDLAVSGRNFSEFSTAVREETSTLLDFDIIDLEQPVQEKLRNSINGEGLIIYEKV